MFEARAGLLHRGQWLAPGIKGDLLDNPHFCSLGVTRGTGIAVAVPGATRAHCWTWLLPPRAVCFCRKLLRNSKLPCFPSTMWLQCSSPAWRGMFIMCLSSSLASGFSHGFTSLDFTSCPSENLPGWRHTESGKDEDLEQPSPRLS